MIELIVQNTDGSRTSLDVQQSEVIVLKAAFMDLTDIGKRRGSFTQNFALPPTETNQEFFGQFGDPPSLGINWSPRVETLAWLLEDTNIIIEGSLKLESTNSDNDKYYVSISSVLFTLKHRLGVLLMSDLDMSQWLILPADVAGTWNGSFANGDIIYSVHDFGQGYGLFVKEGDPAVLTLQNIKSAVAPLTPIRLWNTLPAFRLNQLLRWIFEGIGAVVSGSFFNEPASEQIYVQSDNPLSDFVPNISNLTVWNDTNTLLWFTTNTLIPFIADPVAEEWDDTTHRYTAPVDGRYYWDFTIVTHAGDPDDLIMSVNFRVNGIPQSTPIVTQWGGGASISNHSVDMLAGDWMDITVQLNFDAVIPGTIPPDRQTYMSLSSYTSNDPSTDPSAYLQNYKQIDFLRAITQVFNLVIWTDDQGVFQIDTYTYYQAIYGQKKDWTEKVDLTKKPVVRPINDQLRNPIVLSLKPADDILNKSFVEVTGRNYGDYREDTRIPFTQDAAAPIKIFAPAPTQDILSVNASTNFPEFIIGKLFQDVDNVSYKPPGLQLMYYNGLRTVDTFHTQDEPGGSVTARTAYPYFSAFRLYLADVWRIQENTLDLNFTWWTPPVDIVDAPSNQGLYNRYFRTMLRDRYEATNKIIEFKALLDASDIAGFSFADTIILNLNGTPVSLQILEIKDYSPSSKRLTSIKAMLTFIK